MRVLLVSPINRTYVVMPNLGLGYLASALRKHNHHVEILHCMKEKMDYDRYELFLKRSDFDVVGFQVFSYDLISANRHIQILKKIQPSAFIITGGPHPSGAPLHTMEYFIDVDFAFRGEADLDLPRLINRLSCFSKDSLLRDNSAIKSVCNDIPGLIWRINGKIRVNEKGCVQDLDKIDFPSWDLMDPRDYPEAPHGAFTKNFPVAPIIITRGCPFSCNFCAGHTISGKKVRKRSIANAMSEVEYLIKNYDVKEFTLEDENFTLHTETVQEFCNEILKRDLHISWSCPSGIRLDTFTPELLSLIEKSGCYSFGIGIESGSQRMLDAFRKQITVEKIREQMNLLSKTRIKSTGFFLLGYPSDTKESIITTIKFAKELPLNRVQFNNFMPLPGSEIYGILKKGNRLNNIHWERFFVHDVAYSPDGISPKYLKRVRRRAYLEFYLRPKIIFDILREIKSFRHLKYLLKRFIDALK